MNNLQKTILEIFLKIKYICDTEGLRYFAIGGTAIGTVRHGGFVPWDDDLDIAMPIEDYLCFIEIASQKLEEKYQIILPENKIAYPHMFGKVINTKTTLIEQYISDIPGRYTGVWVDIMPMSGIPNRSFQKQPFIYTLMFMNKLNKKIRWPYSRVERLSGRILYALAYPLKASGKYDFASARYMRLLKKYPFDRAEFTGYTWSDRLKNLIFPKEWFSDYILMPFEDTQIRMPIGYNEYLTQQFGDYMTVPPPEQQITHRVFADLEHSYKDYQSGKLKIPKDYFDTEE